MKISKEDRVLEYCIYFVLIVLTFTSIYPFWNSVVIAFNSGKDTALGGVTFWPREFTLDNFKIVFKDQRLIQGFYISIMRTVIGTLLSILFTALLAYGMSKRELMGRKYYMMMCVITMYFGGGLIPAFLLNRSLGLMDNFWVMIIPGLISVWNMIVFRTFFQSLPDGLEESAKIDGCGYWGTFFRIVAPLSGPVIATLSLFSAIGHWNDWFTASIYISSAELFPIQTLLQQIMNSNIMSDQLMQANAAAQDAMTRMQSVTTKSLTMATMIVSTLPIIMVYPFLQKYFVKGVLVGSLKE